MKYDQATTNKLKTKYERAAVLQNAVNNISKVAFNTVIVPHWIANTNCFWYRRKTKNGVQFRIVEAKAITNKEAFDHKDLANALSEAVDQKIDADNLPIKDVTITLSPLQVKFLAFEKRYRFDAKSQQCQSIEHELDINSRARLVAPDGKKLAFIKNYNLWILNLETGEEHALTQDGEQYYSYASSPILWGYPMNSDLQARWSPDSKTLFTVQSDNRQVKSTPIVHHVPQDGSVRPVVTEYRCGYPGDAHVEELRILAIDVATSSQQDACYRRIPVNRSAYGLFTDNLGWWSNDSRHAYFIDMERGDQVVRVVQFDTKNGDTRILFEEVSPTYLNLSPSELTPATLLPLPDSNELVWFSERSGWAHIYLYDMKTGQVKHPITQGDWLVREILHFDLERRELWFQAGGRIPDRNPYYLDVCRVNIDTGEITTIVATNHEYSVLGLRATISTMRGFFDPDFQVNASGVSPSTDYIVATRSRVDQVPVSILLDRDGKALMEIESANISGLPNNWQWPEPVKLLAADGKTDIYGVVFRPADFSPSQQYPIIDSSMCMAELAGVPRGSFSNADLGGVWYLQAAALAELGFIVVMIGGRGTPYRSKDFVDSSYGWLPSSNHSKDRIYGIKQLANLYTYMDLNRVGIMGFNGSIGPVYGLLQHPDFYKVGVSHAIQDTKLMSTVYSECYEDLAPSKKDSKRAEDIVDNLQGKLLLIHGQLDSMTTSATTWRLINAMEKANKDFDMLILPNEGLPPHINSSYAFRRTWDYFVAHLQGVEPPKEFNLSANSSE